MNKNNIMVLNLEKFIFNENYFKIPFLFETWNWEGDESVLPFKWIDLIKYSELLQKKMKVLILILLIII